MKSSTVFLLFLCGALPALLVPRSGQAAGTSEDGWTALGADAWRNSEQWNVVDGDNLGQRNPCPIEFRNIFIKELEPFNFSEPGELRELNSPLAKLLARIDAQTLSSRYDPQKHQEYVDRRMAGLSKAQRARIGQLWAEKQRLDLNMPNRGQSFVRIMEYVAENVKPESLATGTKGALAGEKGAPT